MSIIELLGYIATLVNRLLEAAERRQKRRELKDQIFTLLVTLLEFTIDGWIDLRVEKSHEGGYDTEVDEIEDVIGEMRSLISEAHTAASANDFDRARDKLEKISRENRKIIRLVRRLRRKQRRAAREKEEKATSEKKTEYAEKN